MVRFGSGEADSAQRFSPLETLCLGTVCSSVVEMKIANGCGASWLQSSLAKLSRSVLNSLCGLGRPPQNCNPPASASQGIVPPDLASWLFIKTWIQSPLCPAVTVTCVSTQGDDKVRGPFLLGSNPGGEKVDRTEGVNGEMPPLQLGQCALCSQRQEVCGGC